MSRWMLQKLSFASNFENTLAPLNFCNNFLQCMSLVMFPDDCVVKVSRV